MGFSYTGPLQPCLTRGEKLTDRLHWMFILCHWMRGGQNEKGGHAYMCVRATLVCVQSWNFTARPVRLAALSTRCVIWASCPGLPTVIRSHYVLWTTDYIQPEPHQLTDIHGSHCGKEKDDRKAQWRPHSHRPWNLKKKRMEQLGILAIALFVQAWVPSTPLILLSPKFYLSHYSSFTSFSVLDQKLHFFSWYTILQVWSLNRLDKGGQKYSYVEWEGE